MRNLLLILSALVFISSYASAQVETFDSINYPVIPEAALTDALNCIKLTPSDIAFRTDNVEPDTFRLPIIDSITLAPLRMISFGNDLSRLLFERTDGLLPILSNFEAIDFGSLSSEIRTSKSGFSGGDESVSFGSGKIDIPAPLDKTIGDRLVKLLNEVNTTASGIKAACDSLFSGLEDTELAFIRDTFPALMLEDTEDEFREVDELDSIQKYEEGLLKRFIPIAEELVGSTEKWRRSRAVGCEAYQSLGRLAEAVKGLIREIVIVDTLEFQIEVETAHGLIAIGGVGTNHYTGKYVFVFDIAGDDRYHMEAVDCPQFILDAAGDDLYSSRTDFTLGSALIYPSFLIDESGDDIYNGRSYSIGSGVFSTGMLIDRQGNDKYLSDTHTQGAGTFGIGILIDHDGSDTYGCSLYGQAFASVSGLGVLCDLHGNDSYSAGGKYKDVLRYDDHYLSLSQGFAYGMRPWMSGGIALLADSAGHDIYISDIFGQGSSYWYALGMQTDFAGNDKYLSFQYAQGVGTHLTLGLLMDKSGSDYYFSKGVSQGCGHDLAAGILIDYFGNDTYQAYDLSQGAGSANGFGWIVDYRGNDFYQIKGRHNSQGYGNPRRDYGSIGLHMDLKGTDEYIGNGKDSSYWIIESKWGVGMDVDYWPADSTGADQ